MIRHLVLLRFKAGIDAQSPEVEAAHQALSELGAMIAGVRSWQCGFNVVPDVDAADYALCASFDDKQALFGYFEHPAHLAVLAQWQTLAELSFVDLE